VEPIEYKARILPDGHLPLPEGIPAKVGDEIKVTIALPEGPVSVEEARKQSDFRLKHWKGVVKSGLSDGALRHDNYLYEGE
jgi:hypothetical protein